ncbi:hypothetical protein Tco_0743817 [Tanacetum coccineum]
MVEPEPMKKMSKKDLLRLDEELAFKLQAEEEEEARLAKKEVSQNKESNIAWDMIYKAKVDADYQLAQRLQAQEQEELTGEGKVQNIYAILKHSKKTIFQLESRREKEHTTNTSSTKSNMCTYLKNMEGWQPKSLKNKSFTNIQELFDKAMKRVNTFVDYRTELVEENSKKVEAEIAHERSSKRAFEELQQESIKKQKVDKDKETEELQSLIEIVLDEEEVAIDAIPLATKPPTIVD